MVWDTRAQPIMCQRMRTCYQAPVIAVQVPGLTLTDNLKGSVASGLRH
jgi:hypothetical protein